MLLLIEGLRLVPLRPLLSHSENVRKLHKSIQPINHRLKKANLWSVNIVKMARLSPMEHAK